MGGAHLPHRLMMIAIASRHKSHAPLHHPCNDLLYSSADSVRIAP